MELRAMTDHVWGPIDQQLARTCSVCKQKFTTYGILITGNIVCPGPPKVKMYNPRRVILSFKKADGTWEEIEGFAPAVCECGAAKTAVKAYEPGHSDWCPLAYLLDSWHQPLI